MLSRAPLLRIVVPFIVGILLADIVEISSIAAIVVCIGIMATIIVMSAIMRKNAATYINSIPMLGGMVMLLATCTGWYVASANAPRHIELSDINGTIAIARIDNIENQNFSTAIQATMLSCLGAKETLPNQTPISITITANNYLLHEGDLLSFSTRLSPIRSLGNPEEFDYAAYMRHNGIIYSQILAPEDYAVVGHDDNIFTISRHIGRYISNKIINSHMHPDTQRFLCTILLGNSSYILPDTRAKFSEAGISHILALSGLHMGIITGIIFLLLQPLNYIGLKRMRGAIAIPIIIAYLFITGMTPSATRSTIMLVFLLVAEMTHRHNSSLNALSAAALLILAFTPAAIYDVGFQLSFAAVLAIIIFYDRFASEMSNHKELFFWLSPIAITTVATLGTTVIAAYYFHTIPLLSIVSNLIVLPLLPFYLCFALIHTILLCCGIEIIEFSSIIDYATSAIDTVATIISELPFSAITHVHISLPVMILFAALYATLAAWLYTKHMRYTIVSLGLIFIIATFNLIEFATLPREGLVIYNDYTSTPIVYFNNGRCKVWCDDEKIDIDKFNRSNAGFISRYHLNDIEITDRMNSNDDNFIAPPFAYLAGKRIAFINSTSWRHCQARHPIEVDYLVIGSTYYGKISDLLLTFKPCTIVLSGGIYDDTMREFLDESATMHIQLHNLRTDGAVVIIGK